MGVAVVLLPRPTAFGGGWCAVARRVGSASAAELTAAAVAMFFSMSCLIPNMATSWKPFVLSKPTCRLSSVPVSPLDHPSF